MTSNDILEVLSTVLDPDLRKDLVTLKMVDNIRIQDNVIEFDLILTTPACPLRQQLMDTCTNAIKQKFPNAEVHIHTTYRMTQSISNPNLKHIKNLVAIVSGKGGVGKSTIALNLAVGLALSGAKVGLLDADLHGPSIPKILGLEGNMPTVVEKEGREVMLPLEKHGIKVMSIGFLIGEDKPLIWRGPMLTSVLLQLFHDTDWGELDYLIIDTPPGTGDVHLTLIQNFSVTGVVLVSTPQEVALSDVRKAANMFLDEKVKVPIIGIIENMSYFVPTDMPEKKYYIFGKDGAKQLSQKLQIRLLGQIPLFEEVMQSGELGVPAVIDHNNPARSYFFELAQKTAQAIAIRNATMEPTPILRVK
ncbi:MAG: Mrp/NBP35 family ATP-binding protein [Bacteroidales bacterium]|nr:Mrp/NBP35 family ATP-binding protein [Bacteroidales bacterium]